MKVVCEYCDAYIESTDEKCPNCGAPNTHFVRTASDSPKTIEQLREFCASKNLPLEKMHVHIGENYQAPKAFGIYRDDNTGRFIVYKNKADGTRAVRYEGADEAYAVNEIYMKIKDLILDARANTAPTQQRSSSSPYTPVKKKFNWKKWLIIIGILAALWVIGTKMEGKVGYYNQNGNIYYRHGSHWYALENGEWGRTYDEIDDDYYVGHSYYGDGDADFEEFPEYSFRDDWSSSSDYDSDSDWSSYDDWDSDDDYSWSDSYDSYDYDSSYDWDSDW
ncbi:MAG: hypothetical protein IKI90_04935 [Treponema sp.]|nr:hypothetical protein [Treponema sp.]